MSTKLICFIKKIRNKQSVDAYLSVSPLKKHPLLSGILPPQNGGVGAQNWVGKN
jgi:hypothetical protein